MTPSRDTLSGMSTEDPGGSGPVLPSSDPSGRGFLTVGHNDTGEVVVNFPRLPTDRDGFFWMAFTPAEARHLATLLRRKASEAEKAVRPGRGPVL